MATLKELHTGITIVSATVAVWLGIETHYSRGKLDAQKQEIEELVATREAAWRDAENSRQEKTHRRELMKGLIEALQEPKVQQRQLSIALHQALLGAEDFSRLMEAARLPASEEAAGAPSPPPEKIISQALAAARTADRGTIKFLVSQLGDVEKDARLSAAGRLQGPYRNTPAAISEVSQQLALVSDANYNSNFVINALYVLHLSGATAWTAENISEASKALSAIAQLTSLGPQARATLQRVVSRIKEMVPEAGK